MKSLTNEYVSITLDDRYPRVLHYQDAAGGARIVGGPEAVAPRVYVFRKADRATLASDDAAVGATYSLHVEGVTATYRANVTCDGKPAVEFDVVVELQGRDLVVEFRDVREHEGFCLLSVRWSAIATALAADADSKLLTCNWQGRVLDPAKCSPMLVDYSWVGFTARPCGAIYRPEFMVTIDLPGYEDLLIHDVRQYSRVGEAPRFAALGTEVMYRQREVGDPDVPVKIYPPKDRCPEEIPPDEPIRCGGPKGIRLHFISAQMD